MKIFLALLLTCCLAAPALAFEAILVRVADGDSFIVRKGNGRTDKVRLYGIDAPERGQAFSHASGDNLHNLLRGKLEIDVLYRDKFNRAVALVTSSASPDITVNEQQIRDGMAWLYPLFCKEDFCNEWEVREEEARAANMGLWRDPAPRAPWVWKRHKK